MPKYTAGKSEVSGWAIGKMGNDHGIRLSSSFVEENHIREISIATCGHQFIRAVRTLYHQENQWK